MSAAGIDAGELHVGRLHAISVGVLPAGLAPQLAAAPDTDLTNAVEGSGPGLRSPTAA
jgi:hypothetical protein